eukprot:CAMPEP_0184291360 /NCGR_PEP_ID=MMETSP1049-20130417/3412_1 /TAXON_ID=77928 /ORGANISM="Proteomonas sulcata, Strain CCMP704" /LENGTH=162 /DNA_ID=CAMNT_0026598797 /DNA_START=1 /DNA_END=485 /DNA_ORIENTATION=+
MGDLRVTVTSKTKFNRSTLYEVKVEGFSYGRSMKKWDHFEELYDSLELRYGEEVKEIEFPAYTTRKEHSKKDAVEENRQALQTLLSRLLRLPKVRNDADVSEFFQLTESIGSGEGAAPGPSEGLRNAAGPTPFTVKGQTSRPPDFDDADSAGDEMLGVEGAG